MLMCDGVGWGPGSFVAPEAAPVLPSAVSSDVQWIMNNMLCLQHMGPEEAAKILKDIAALQGPYEDFQSSALCVHLGKPSAVSCFTQ